MAVLHFWLANKGGRVGEGGSRPLRDGFNLLGGDIFCRPSEQTVESFPCLQRKGWIRS